MSLWPLLPPALVGAAAFATFWVSALLMRRRDLASTVPADTHAGAGAGAVPPGHVPDAVPPIEPPGDLFPPAEGVERIGLILVHGIGDQTRFEHLDGHLRAIVSALLAQQEGKTVDQLTVEIVGTGVAALHAQQESWASGPGASVIVSVRHRLDGAWREARIFVHEVWWADVNERYSLAKQFRFWLWGLAIWAHPARLISNLGSASDVRPPEVPNRNLMMDRLRLWLVGAFCALLGSSVGLVSFFVTRVFGWQAPRLLRTIANYISAVKLYNQQSRFGAGLLWAREEFLDTIGEPPRVSIRRRMEAVGAAGDGRGGADRVAAAGTADHAAATGLGGRDRNRLPAAHLQTLLRVADVWESAGEVRRVVAGAGADLEGTGVS